MRRVSVFTVVALAILAGAAPRAAVGALAPPRAAARIALLADPTLPVRGAPSSPAYLEKLLAKAGYGVVRLSASDLTSEAVLDPSKIDVLVLPQGASYPAKGRDALYSFLKRGGDFISMGGYAFDDLCYKNSSGKWQAREELYGIFRPDPSAGPIMLFDLEGSLDGWNVDSGTDDVPILRKASGRAGGTCLEIDIPYYWNWHGAAHKVGVSIPKGYGFVSFWAKGDEHTQQMTVGCREKDQSRWIAVVELTPEWKHYVIPARDFEHWHDNTARGDELHLDNALTISFGLAFTHTKRVAAGPHVIWVDDVVALKGTVPDLDDRVNTHYHTSSARWPLHEYVADANDRINRENGVASADMIGAFDASSRLKWVASAQASPDQAYIDQSLKLDGKFAGYSAIGWFRLDTYRWVPLINTYDRYGRPRGSLGSLVIHHSGDRRGSAWAFFGVDNTDLFSPRYPQMSKAFVDLVNAMTRGLYLTRTSSELASYRAGEVAKALTTVSNFGSAAHDVTVRLQILGPDGAVVRSADQRVSLARRESRKVSISWEVPASPSDFYRIRAAMLQGEKVIDVEDSAFVVWTDRLMFSGPKLTLKNGRFELDGAPRFLLGANEGSVFWQGQPKDDPLAWDRELRAMANDGLRIVRIHPTANWFWPKDGQPVEPLYRVLDAFIQLCRKYGIAPYIDTLDAGGDLQYAATFAKRYKDVSGIMYDEDNESADHTRSTPERVAAWNEWLTQQYGSTDGLAKAWGKYWHGDKLGEVPYSPGGDAWDNRRSFDWRYFHRTEIVANRWAGDFAATIRQHDPDAFVAMSGLNIGGHDQLAATEHFDLCDNHFYHCWHQLPSLIKGCDLRPLGKASVFGEYGVMTHPAGYGGYYYAPEDQVKHFLMVGHELAGCGGAMGLNWIYRDSMNAIFPWGLRFPGDLIEKDVLRAHRQSARFFSRLPLDAKMPPVVVCAADNNRLGGQGGRADEAYHRVIQVLVDNHVDFTVIRESKLDNLPAGTRALFFPVPYCISDQTFAQLRGFVEKGGALYISGDVCYSPERVYLGDDRLRELAGVRFVSEPSADDIWACRKVESVGAQMIDQVLAVNQLGKGTVVYSAASIETEPFCLANLAMVWGIYERLLDSAGVSPNRIQPNLPSIHCYRQPLTDGGSAYMLINQDGAASHRVTVDTEAGRVELPLESMRTGVVAVDAAGRIRALEAQGSVTLNAKPLVDAKGHFFLTTLDGNDVAKSKAMMLLPIGAGSVRVRTTAAWDAPLVKVGQPDYDTWQELEEFGPASSGGVISFSWDEVQAPGVFVLTDKAGAPAAIQRVMDPLGAF